MLLYRVVYNQLRVDDIENKLQLNQPVQVSPPANLVFVFKNAGLWVEGSVVRALKIIFDDKIQHPRVLAKYNTMLVGETNVSRFVWVNGFDYHARLGKDYQGRRLVARDPSQKLANILCG